jgi:hypothetical protein
MVTQNSQKGNTSFLFGNDFGPVIKRVTEQEGKEDGQALNLNSALGISLCLNR